MNREKTIKQIIDLINSIDIDAETMEDILEEVGLREQICKQVIDSEKYISVKKLWDDVQNNDTLWCSSFDEYYTHNFLK
jgi:hypothetical protein